MVLRHFLCSRKLGLKKPVSDWRQKIQTFKERLSNLKKNDFDFQLKLDKTVEKNEISDLTRQSDSCIGNVRKTGRILARVSHTHTTTRHTTQPHTTTSATLAWLQHVTAPDGRSVRYQW